MQIKIDKDKATLIQDEIQNSGAINEYEIEVDFSEEWDNLTKKAIFVDSTKPRNQRRNNYYRKQ